MPRNLVGGHKEGQTTLTTGRAHIIRWRNKKEMPDTRGVKKEYMRVVKKEVGLIFVETVQDMRVRALRIPSRGEMGRGGSIYIY